MKTCGTSTILAIPKLWRKLQIPRTLLLIWDTFRSLFGDLLINLEESKQIPIRISPEILSSVRNSWIFSGVWFWISANIPSEDFLDSLSEFFPGFPLFLPELMNVVSRILTRVFFQDFCNNFSLGFYLNTFWDF